MTPTIPERESLTVEFKSDHQRDGSPLSDSELVAAVVCLANAEGGELYVGVEDDGTVTGLHPDHARNVAGVAALIANRTNPPLTVRVERLEVAGDSVARIAVPRSDSIVSTSDGLIQRRRMQADGRPACMPFYPHEFAQRQSDLGRLDYSALPVAGATEKDLDPLERQRLRSLVARYGGDSTLAALSDEELDGVLGLVARENGRRTPTVAGLLTIGREQALRQYLPPHEVAVQDLTEARAVRLNDFTRRPLLEVFERVYEQVFSARVVEEELQVGLFRVPVPNYDRRAFREGFVNALIHRDYTRLGAVHIRWEADGLTLSNPGGFVEGVTLDNLIVTEPRPRNPRLADIMKRVGIAERTARGVDLIYQGLLRYGRPAPDYSASGSATVVLRLSSGAADLPFIELILEEERRLGTPMPVDSLIVLSELRAATRLNIEEVARAIQKNDVAARGVMGRLVEAGLVQMHGTGVHREYTLSVAAYRRLGQTSPFSLADQERLVLEHVRQRGRITRQEAADLCRLSLDQASRLLRRLADQNLLTPPQRSGRGAHYTLPGSRV
jgi:ATP-dependent DNA helicase RecG